MLRQPQAVLHRLSNFSSISYFIRLQLPPFPPHLPSLPHPLTSNPPHTLSPPHPSPHPPLTLFSLSHIPHQPDYPVCPHFSHTSTLCVSELIISRSRRSWLAPYAIRQSRSISPKRSPPSRARPSVG